MCHPIQHPAHIQLPMTLPHDPTLFLAHGKAHKTQTQSQPCQELKMPTHQAHPPPSRRNSYQLNKKTSADNNHQQIPICHKIFLTGLYRINLTTIDHHL